MSATAASASLKSFDFERSMTGARCETAAMPLLWFANRHVGDDVRAARNCAGRGRRETMREGREATSLYDVGIASIAEHTSMRNAVRETRNKYERYVSKILESMSSNTPRRARYY